MDSNFRPVSLAPTEPEIERRGDGSLLIRARDPLDPHPVHYGQVLEGWAAAAPDRTALAERDADGAWHEISWRDLHDRANRVAAALLDMDLSPEHPLVLFAEPSIRHGILMLAAMQAGIPVAPLAPAYAGPGADIEKLRHVLDLLTPGAIVLDDGTVYEDALDQWPSDGIAFIHLDRAPERRPSRPFETLAENTPDAPDAAGRLAEASARIRPDDMAKVMFTSGSTGMPKGVITTHRMLMANQQAWVQVHPYLREHPPLIVDWLPWNHCYAGNFNLGCALYNGGTYRMARGQPVGDRFEPVLAAMAEHPPTVHMDVPQGFEKLADRLDADADFARLFFSRLDALFYAGSTMPEPLWRRIEEASRRTTGQTIVITTGYGSTETTPLHTMATRPSPGPRHIGLPAPGAEVLLLPDDDRWEIRVRGENVTPGYLKDAERTREAFDEEGFYVTGDAVRFVDPDDVLAGLYFEGRVGLNFKLLSGTWVRVDAVRISALEALGTLARDVIVAGHEEACVALLVFPDLVQCRALAALPATASVAEIVRHPAVVSAVAAALRTHNEAHPGSSRRIARALLLDEPPSVYDGEVTDKRYLNQKTALARRSGEAGRLFAEPPDTDVIIV